MRTEPDRRSSRLACAVITVPEEAPLAEIARALEAHRIKRVPVVRDGRLVGIVSRADVLRGLVACTSLVRSGRAPMTGRSATRFSSS